MALIVGHLIFGIEKDYMWRRIRKVTSMLYQEELTALDIHPCALLGMRQQVISPASLFYEPVKFRSKSKIRKKEVEIKFQNL